MKKLIMAVSLVFSALFLTAPVLAADFNPACSDPSIDYKAKQLAGCDTGKEKYGNVARDIINTVIAIIGVVTVGVVVFAGQRYITSNGDPGKTKQAKDMLVWGLIGLGIAISAALIVNFVITSLQ